jgi:hypothetical protein
MSREVRVIHVSVTESGIYFASTYGSRACAPICSMKLAYHAMFLQLLGSYRRTTYC